MEDEINELKAKLAQKDKIISDLERIIKAYEAVSEISRNELLDAYKTIEAQEKVQLLTQSELRERDEIIEAEEKIMEMSAEELKQAKKEILAREIVEELARKELLDKDKVIKAMEVVSDMMVKDIKERDKIIQAFEIAEEMARQEIINLKKEAEAKENVIELAEKERKETLDIIKAYENLEEYARMEKEEIIKTSRFLLNMFIGTLVNLGYIKESDQIEVKRIAEQLVNEKWYVNRPKVGDIDLSTALRIIEAHEIVEELMRKEKIEMDNVV
ncbi:MAG: hypothetical protein ACK4F9_06315, partial [Brevinematia bacterium]